MFIEILFKMLLFKGGLLIYTEHCNYLKNHKMNKNSTYLSMCEHSAAKLMTQQSESQNDINRSTSYYVFWKMYPGNGIQRGI